MVFVLNSCGNNSGVKVLKESVAETDIALKVLVRLEDGNDILLSKAGKVLVNSADKVVNNGEAVNISRRGLSECSKKTAALSNIKDLEVLILSKGSLVASNKEIEVLDL